MYLTVLYCTGQFFGCDQLEQDAAVGRLQNLVEGGVAGVQLDGQKLSLSGGLGGVGVGGSSALAAGGSRLAGQTEAIGISDVRPGVDSGLVDVGERSGDDAVSVALLLSGRDGVGVAESGVSELITGTVLAAGGVGHGGSDSGSGVGNSDRGGVGNSGDGSGVGNSDGGGVGNSDGGGVGNSDGSGVGNNGGDGVVDATVGGVSLVHSTDGGVGSDTSDAMVTDAQKAGIRLGHGAGQHG